MKKLINLLLIAGITFMYSCGGADVSKTTGWAYDDPDYGGFESYSDYAGQETGPGLVRVEGGAFTMGRVEQDIMFDWNNIPRRVTIPSFYMDETEISNLDYREYLHWLVRVFESYPEVHTNALPDTLVWRRRLAYNEPYVEYYLRHPAYKDYPVVGVNWNQAVDYCVWRTDRVNEQILIDQKIFETNPGQIDAENFNTDAYLAGQYQGIEGKNPVMNKTADGEEPRTVRIEDGIMLPKYELPTEAQWEYAALGLIGNSADERVFNRKLYPWNGHYVRNDTKKYRGQMMANFQRGRGDMMGIAGALNDNASITARVDAYWPNDYGLYCMAGNVNEWVRDVYRPLNSMDFAEFRPFRGNVFMKLLTDEEGQVMEKDSLGRLRKIKVTEEETVERWNYQRADNINYNDGDVMSSISGEADWLGEEKAGSERMYKQGTGKGTKATGMVTLISDKAHIFKGGGWRDRIYWMNPATRRYLEDIDSRDDLGFRCAMISVGSQGGNNIEE